MVYSVYGRGGFAVTTLLVLIAALEGEVAGGVATVRAFGGAPGVVAAAWLEVLRALPTAPGDAVDDSTG